MTGPVLVGAFLGFLLGSVFGVHIACAFLRWASRQPAASFTTDTTNTAATTEIHRRAY